MPFTHDCKKIGVMNCSLCNGELYDSMDGHRVVGIDIWYPGVGRDPDKSDRNADVIQIGLMDVRAADDIRISYDYARDGYSIKQASRFSWDADDKVCDEDWQEVAFVQAWTRQVPGPGDDEYEARRSGGR